MSDWNDCIVSFIDMIDVGSLLRNKNRDAVIWMRRMHKAVEHTGPQLSAHAEVCFWNDSVLLVGFVDKSRSSYRTLMEEVCLVKKAVDNVKSSYAICVKGKAFPKPPPWSKGLRRHAGGLNLIYLQASSLAFANCFEIDHLARKENWNWEWYIDSRISNKIRLRQADNWQNVTLFPRNILRKVNMYNGSFWPLPNV